MGSGNVAASPAHPADEALRTHRPAAEGRAAGRWVRAEVSAR